VIIRENEVMALIDQVSTPAFIKDTFNGWEKAQLDLTKIVVGGHSFGGITALGATCADRRVKACIGLDPWFFPHYKELNAGKFAVKCAD
jgi:predicted dienelactone hydrolase